MSEAVERFERVFSYYCLVPVAYGYAKSDH